MILNFVDKNSLKKLVEYGYNELDAAYSLAYKIVLEEALDFLNLGLASDPQIRRNIEKVVIAKQTKSIVDILRYSIEIVKIEGAKRGEMVEISVAAVIPIFASKADIKDKNFLRELKDCVRKVQKKYSGQAEMVFKSQMIGVQTDPKINQVYREFFCQSQGQINNEGQNIS